MTYSIDFVGKRKLFFGISILLIIAGVVSLFVQQLNLGIDFVSGTRLDISMDRAVNIDESKNILTKLGYQNPNARVGGKKSDILIFRTSKTITPAKVAEITSAFNKAFKTKVSVQSQVVDPIIGRELARNAIIATLLACVAIVIYVSIRFEHRFAIAAVITLFYDALFTIGIFSIFQIEVDVVFIAAILTIIGYSINDTIVIFDRIRENYNRQQPKKWDDLASMVNESIQQTLVRSINTVVTVLLAALALVLLGGESIRNFSLALILGLVSGAYSSIFIASQIWVVWTWKSIQKKVSSSA
ncbi:protein translocase subunit SecF [Shimazuella sp. AN120528]|uniref:protein translocase subunit SecF n=1 Tax=Shimazuella soli TaxID=1892854 RepID=UPI001F1189C6|nr:protein translocase subunit SecF [Shimazuella soli]